ncbi:SDR family NAD(P)-dependent oxidoreductase [Aquimarina agarivorans]|uniref:SDR family NAD(P)-dependent oxidoreductase n=1 Tax=Aquimarina agarivorans TaxID=980584 RepID=UPI000248E860|nr:SDR family oxidoreductase [Aquimarina agarivorans]
MIKTALITGASSGIGKELAFIHAENKGDLVIVARNEEKLLDLKTTLKETYGINVLVIVKDLTKPNAPQQVYNEVKSAGFQIDYLINNAGFGGVGEFYKRNLAQEMEMIQLNVMALTALTHLFLQNFIQLNQGKILNASSTASLMAGSMQAVYFATKAYVTSFSNALAEELKGTNVTVTNLMPGATDTEFAKTSGMDKTSLFDNTATAKSVATDGYQAMLYGKLDVITGLTFSQKLLMALVPFIPKKMMLKQIKEMQTDKK